MTMLVSNVVVPPFLVFLLKSGCCILSELLFFSCGCVDMSKLSVARGAGLSLLGFDPPMNFSGQDLGTNPAVQEYFFSA